VIIDESKHLEHYGTPRHSGRYPWGSGGDESGTPRNPSFLDMVDDLKRQGLSESDIAKGMGMSTTQLRAKRSIARNELRQQQIQMANDLKFNKGYSNTAAASRMGIPESTFRTLIVDGAADRADILTSVSNVLKSEVDSKKFVDVGAGNENYLGISQTKLNTALSVLKEQGYSIHTVKVPQLGTQHETKVKVLCPPGTTWGEAQKNRYNIKLLSAVSTDGGRNFSSGKIYDAIPIDPKRVKIRYKEEGGDQADGVLFVRDGVPDVSLGNSKYAQVRVQVGDSHYLKGMAMYKEDLPAGVDIVFNTNKSSTGNKFDAMKSIKEDSDLPFGAQIRRQILTDVGTPNERPTSAMNIINEQGNWKDWSKTLSSQVLSKQPLSLAKQQLEKNFEERRKEFDRINALTNPTVKKKLLQAFSDGTDSSAVHLDAAALNARQAWHAILPINSLKPTEVYAPRYNDGEKVVLIRHPHGGTFEIPELKVNNRNREGRSLIGDAPDAIGIHHSVAHRLSGADFDGDTVIVIPDKQNKIKSTRPLEGLKNFDPRSEYAPYDGMRTIDGGVYNAKKKEVEYPDKPASGKRLQQEMGNISNLITDMTIKLASHDEIVRAIRHSMVIIDSEKHHLNFKESARRNGILELKREYQSKEESKGLGASTLISLATSETRVPHRIPRPAKSGGSIDRDTGKKVFVPSGQTYRDGRIKKIVSTKLAETDDAHSLSSGTPMERVYADHSNKMKALANQARKTLINTPDLKYSASAKKVYAKEVSSLNSKLDLAQRNAPLERQAQIIGNAQVKLKRDANPNLEPAALIKIKNQAMEDARSRMGANKKERQIQITPEEWNAIQAGAISNAKLEAILTNTDLELIRQYATPRRQLLMSPSKTALAQRLLASGATRAEVAQRLGVSLTTLDTATA
jgi:hypothetical protein